MYMYKIFDVFNYITNQSQTLWWSTIVVVDFYSMKTSLFKWKPDLEGAAVEYGKAGEHWVEFLFYFQLLVAGIGIEYWYRVHFLWLMI